MEINNAKRAKNVGFEGNYKFAVTFRLPRYLISLGVGARGGEQAELSFPPLRL